MRNVLWAALMMSLSAAPLRAQWWGGGDDAFLTEPLTRAAAVTPQVAMNRCLVLGRRRRAPSGSSGPLAGCVTRGWEALKPVRGERFFIVQYVWPPPAEDGEPYDWRERETVLFSRARGGSRLTPIWHSVFFQRYYGAVDPEPAPAPGGGLLLGTLACFDGTGGCRQQFSLRRGGRWRAVSQPWIRSLPSWMPPQFNKGTYVDGRTLQARAGLYSPRDGNCCPSHEVSARLALRGTRLVLRSYRVIPAANQ